MTGEEIEQKLNEMLLNFNWGTVERKDGIPANIAIINEALTYIHHLQEQIHEIRQNNIRDQKRIRKDTAKEILEHFPHNLAREFFCKKFGIEVDDE